MSIKITLDTPFGQFTTTDANARFLVLGKSFGGSPIKAYWVRSREAVQSRVLDLRQRQQRMLGVFNVEAAALTAAPLSMNFEPVESDVTPETDA